MPRNCSLLDHYIPGATKIMAANGKKVKVSIVQSPFLFILVAGLQAHHFVVTTSSVGLMQI
jgi:hypothetical protein